MPSVLFESTDTDAPVLDQSQGAMINVLRACLVTGYGSKSPLGWEEVYYDAANYKWVVRQKESKAHRPYIRISDTGSDFGNNQTDRVYVYDIMYGVDEGVNRQPISDETYHRHNFTKSGSSTCNAPWKLIGDGRGFWILVGAWCHYTDAYLHTYVPHYVGDFESWRLNYRFPFVTMLKAYYGGFSFDVGSGSYHNACFLYRTYNNALNTGNYKVYPVGLGGHEYVPGNCGYFDGGMLNGIPHFAGTVAYHPILLSSNQLSGRVIVGALPGFSMSKEADNSNQSANTSDPYTETVGPNTDIMTFFCRYHSSDPNISWNSRLSLIIGEGFRNVF